MSLDKCKLGTDVGCFNIRQWPPTHFPFHLVFSAVFYLPLPWKLHFMKIMNSQYGYSIKNKTWKKLPSVTNLARDPLIFSLSSLFHKALFQLILFLIAFLYFWSFGFLFCSSASKDNHGYCCYLQQTCSTGVISLFVHEMLLSKSYSYRSCLVLHWRHNYSTFQQTILHVTV